MNRRQLFGLFAGLVAAPAELLTAEASTRKLPVVYGCNPVPMNLIGYCQIHAGEPVVPARFAANRISPWDYRSVERLVKSPEFRTSMKGAAKSFGATYASRPEIPYVGWVMKPGAAAAAFARVAAFERMASLDVGVWDVPHDMRGAR